MAKSTKPFLSSCRVIKDSDKVYGVQFVFEGEFDSGEVAGHYIL